MDLYIYIYIFFNKIILNFLLQLIYFILVSLGGVVVALVIGLVLLLTEVILGEEVAFVAERTCFPILKLELVKEGQEEDFDIRLELITFEVEEADDEFVVELV